MDPATAATLAEVHAHGHGKTVTVSDVYGDGRPAAVRVSGPAPGTSLRRWSVAGDHAAVVARTLRAALAPRRWEPWNRYQEHRAYPSPRTAYLVDVVVRVGDQRWALDPVRELLTPLTAAARGGVPAGGGSDPLAPRTGQAVEVLLAVHPARLPAGYGALAGALAWLECGHVAGALAEAAAAAGLATSWRMRRHRAGVALALRPHGGPGWPWSRVAARRSSGLGPRGLAPDPRPLPRAVLAELAAATAAIPPGSPAGAGAPLRHMLAVRGVTRATDGWYAVADGVARLRTAAAAMDAVQQAAGAPESVADIAGMNLAWVMTAAVGRAVRTGGADQYRRLLVTAGATAQHVATAAAAGGLFCRPIRNVREGALEAAAGAPADHDFLYLLLIGRSSVRDFAYDLSDPEVMPPLPAGDDHDHH